MMNMGARDALGLVSKWSHLAFVTEGLGFTLMYGHEVVSDWDSFW
jgi:hypothetical protein